MGDFFWSCFRWLSSTAEKYLTADLMKKVTFAAGVMFFPSCRRVLFPEFPNFRCIQQMNPNISRTIDDQDPSNCHTKAFSRNWHHSTRNKKTPTTDKHTQQLSQKKNKRKNLHDFLKRSGSFFFTVKLWNLQEFDPDFIFISAGFDGHEAWGDGGLLMELVGVLSQGQHLTKTFV